MGAIRNTRACGDRFAHMSGRGAQAVLVEHVCTLVPGHDRAHTDGDRRWTDPVSTVETVHLHKPAGGTYCGAQVLDRKRETTAYRSEATCPTCIGGLR